MPLINLNSRLCISDGVFGAMMQVHIQNDGPVTIEIESPRSTKSFVVEEASTAAQ